MAEFHCASQILKSNKCFSFYSCVRVFTSFFGVSLTPKRKTEKKLFFKVFSFFFLFMLLLMKGDTVFIFSLAHSGTVLFPTVSQQCWDFGSCCLAAVLSNRYTKPSVHLRKATTTEEPLQTPWTDAACDFGPKIEVGAMCWGGACFPVNRSVLV